MEALAFKKVALHCAKHPSSNVYGVLTGSQNIQDAIPLFHTNPTTSITQVALAWISSTYPVIGFYQSRIRSPDSRMQPSNLMEGLCSGLRSKTGGQCLVLCVESDWDNPDIAVVFRFSKGGNSFDKVEEVGQELVEIGKTAVLDWSEIYDFEDHLEDPKIDWRNPHIQ